MTRLPPGQTSPGLKRATVVSAEDAVAQIPSGARVSMMSGAAEPQALLSALLARASDLESVTLVCGLLTSGQDLLSTSTAFHLSTWFPGTSQKAATVEYVPLGWRQIGAYLKSHPSDYTFVQVGPKTDDGGFRHGISSSHTQELIQSAQVVVAEVNESMPHLSSDTALDANLFDFAVHTNRPLPAFPARPIEALDRAVGEQIAHLAPPAAEMQFGVGAIPASTAHALAGRRLGDARVIGQLGDWAPRLLDAIEFTGEPLAIISEIGGSPELYQWAHLNPRVRMADANETHRAVPTEQIRPRFSVNSALQIDLWGQANCETVSGRAVGPLGGLIDFASAVRPGTDDLFTIGLRSTTSSGTSRIVPELAGPASLSRSLVQVVVTEFGTADLRGLSPMSRATALIAVAAPENRQALKEAAERMFQ